MQHFAAPVNLQANDEPGKLLIQANVEPKTRAFASHFVDKNYGQLGVGGGIGFN